MSKIKLRRLKIKVKYFENRRYRKYILNHKITDQNNQKYHYLKIKNYKYITKRFSDLKSMSNIFKNIPLTAIKWNESNMEI